MGWPDRCMGSFIHCSQPGNLLFSRPMRAVATHVYLAVFLFPKSLKPLMGCFDPKNSTLYTCPSHRDTPGKSTMLWLHWNYHFVLLSTELSYDRSAAYVVCIDLMCITNKLCQCATPGIQSFCFQNQVNYLPTNCVSVPHPAFSHFVFKIKLTIPGILWSYEWWREWQ